MKGTVRLNLKAAQARKLKWMAELRRYFGSTDTVFDIRQKVSFISWRIPERGIQPLVKIRRPTAIKFAKKFAALPKNVYEMIASKQLSAVLDHIVFRTTKKKSFEAIFMATEQGLHIAVTNLRDADTRARFFLRTTGVRDLPYTLNLEPRQRVEFYVHGPAGNHALLSSNRTVLARASSKFVWKKYRTKKDGLISGWIKMLDLNPPTHKRVAKPAAAPAPVLAICSFCGAEGAPHSLCIPQVAALPADTPHFYPLPPVAVVPHEVHNFEWGAPEYPIPQEYLAAGM